jgi:hypothetical protein
MKRAKTPTFLIELPLLVDSVQASHLRARLEAARALYNALLGEARKRLRRMRADLAWAQARAIPHTRKAERRAAFSGLRRQYQFSEYALHEHAKRLRRSWIADHIDSTMAQTLATRAYHAVNRVCLGKAKKVRFKSVGRGLDSVEGKRNDTGMRFLLQAAEEGHEGWLIWGEDRMRAIIDWHDPLIHHGLLHTIKYVRLLRRKASSPRAKGADSTGCRYSIQLVLRGQPHQKPKHQIGHETIGLDIGPSTLAMVPREGQARLSTFCEQLRPNTREKRRLQRKMDRQRRANNPQNYDEKGRVKKQGQFRLRWKNSQRYLATRRHYAHAERKLAAHRKSLHGRLVHEIVRVGNRIQIEKTSYQGWQKRYGKSVGLRAPGMFVAHLARIVAKTGGTLHEVSTFKTKLSQYCHGCGTYLKKPLSQRWHQCPCGIGPVQRDLYSAFLLASLEGQEPIPSISRHVWEGAETRLQAEMERLQQRANEGHHLPRSVGIPRAGARRLESLEYPRQELLLSGRCRRSVGGATRTPALHGGESQETPKQSPL